MAGFGITKDTVSTGTTPMQGGIQKAILVDVKKEEVGKKETKYTVLSFTFKDVENIKTFKHTEFAFEENDEKYAQKMSGFNGRTKHIFEQYASFPTEGIGNDATSFSDYFDKIALAFNTGNNGKPIYKVTKGDKEVGIPVWVKLNYDRRDNLQFPLFPMFIEGIKEDNIVKPKTLAINKQFDKTEQSGKGVPTNPVLGGGEADNFVF